MFVNLPQKLTAPFGLLGDDAKLAFPTHPGGIAKLASVRNIPDNDTYWEQYFTLFDSASDIFALINPHHIRKALLDAPENIATLIRVVSTRLFNLITDHTFPSSTGSMTAFASSFIKAGTGMSERNTTKEVLNCLRILQRVLPVLFELDAEMSPLEEDIMWKKEEVDSAPDTTEDPQFVIEDEDEDASTSGQTQDAGQAHRTRKQLPSLAERLFDSLFDLLFCCGFTLPLKIQIDHHKIQHVIWEKGVGSTMDFGLNAAFDTNKIEVLRLLLVLLSRQIYVSPNSLFSKPSPYTLHLVQKMPRRKVLTLLCSLLNTAMNTSSTNDKSFGSMAGRLPYNHLVFKGEDHRTTLLGLCLQVLCILLDFQSGSARDKAADGSDPCALPTPRTNVYRYFVMKLHRTQDFEFIYQGILSILYHQIASTSNLLPGARKPVPHTPEIVVLCWKMLELNKRFLNHILGSDKAMNLPVYLLCYGLDIRDKPQQHGLCRAISYIVQTLSAESAFGTNLSLPLRVQTPAKWNTAGTTADFLINAIHAMVTNPSGGVNSLYPALIITLSNLAPYFKNLSMTASSKLMQLFTSFSNPLFLLADEGHPRLVFFMLEVFNSVIFHHPSNNSNLLCCILSSSKVFEDLGTFTLSKGLGEISRVQDPATRLESHATISGDRSGEKGFSIEEGIGSTATPTRQIDVTLPPQFETHDDQEGTVPRIATSSVGMDSESNLPSATSGKAKGKMKERRSSSLDVNSISERLAGAGISRNGFTPTQEWVASWQERLPLDVVMLVISELLPKIQQLQASQKANPASAIKDLLSTNDLSHVLPQAPTISPRRFMWSDASIIWLTSLIWGEIYVRAMTPLGVWNGTNVRLFYVKHTQFQQRQITDTVSQVVGGLLRRNSDAPQTWRS
ncbi:High-temperature-induced dauer-formation domain containing protein [Amanita muscaria]